MVAQRLTIPQWRALHTATVIGSGAAANVVGVGYGSPLQEWGERTGRIKVEDIGDDDPVWLGREMESTVLRFHAKKSGTTLAKCLTPGQREAVESALTAHGTCEVVGWVEDRQPYIRSTRYPWMVATLDGFGMRDGHNVTIEAKYPGLRQISKWIDGAAPDPYRLQVQHTLITIGGAIPEGDLVALIGHDYRCVTVSLADTNVRAIVELERHFVDCVERDVEPAIDASPSAMEAFKTLHPDDDGCTVILPMEAIEIHKCIADIEKQLEPLFTPMKALLDKRTAYRARLMQMIGSHTYGALPDGSGTYSLKTTERQASAASTYRTLRLAGSKS